MPLIPLVAMLLVEDATDCAFEGITLDVPLEMDALARSTNLTLQV